MKSVFVQYSEHFSDIHYCPYCLNIKGNKIVCCQEADFIPFKDLDLDQQKAIIEDELDTYRSKYVNRSITEKECQRSR